MSISWDYCEPQSDLLCKGFFIMGGYKYVDEYILQQYVFFILMSQARWIVLNVLLMYI